MQIYRRADLGPDWHPPDCASSLTPRPDLLVALAGRFKTHDEMAAPLARFGAVSALKGVRYWSTTDGQWQNLISAANALEGPDLSRRRADFNVEDLVTGRELYFSQADNRSSALVVYSMRVQNPSSHRFVVEIRNVTAVYMLVLPLYPSGSLRSVYFLDQSSPGTWDYYSLMEVGADASPLALTHEKSYVNRAVALFRHIAGIPTDQDPPAAQ